MVKLSYYFPMSSDSVSLKKQLLESGVLDITNETMYRMAPEAVDPSILSRGSLSHRRYTRSALLMLREDKLSKELPKCLKNTHLLKFPFWKLNKIQTTTEESKTKSLKLIKDNNSFSTKLHQNNNNNSNNNNSNINNESNTFNNSNNYFNYNNKNTYNNSYNNNRHYNNNNYNNQSNIRYSLHKNHYSNKFNNRLIGNNELENIQLKFDCHEGRFIEKYECENEGFMKYKDYSSGQTNTHYPYMIPNFVKNKYDRISKRDSEESISHNQFDNNENFIKGNKFDNVETNLGVASDISERKDNEHQINCMEEIFSNKNMHLHNSKHNDNQRYGSGRITLQNKNWNYVSKNIDTDLPCDTNNRSGRFLDNNSNNWNDNKSYNNNIYKYNRYNYNESDNNYITHNNSTDKNNQQNPTNRNNHYHYYKNNTNNHNYSRYRKESFSSSNHSGNSEEPEWLNCGPISQNDIIELKGFDDDPASDKEDESCDKNQKTKNLSIENENKEVNLEMLKFSEDNCSTAENKTKDHINTTSRTVCNDEIHSVCTSTAPSPPPARSTPTKLLNLYSNKNKKFNPRNNLDMSNAANDHNKKNYYSLQFSFDNFLDYDTLNNMFGGNSKSKSNHWFKTHHNGSFNNDTRNKQNFTVFDKRNYKQHEQFPKNVINVKDLEDQMRKIGYYKNLPYQNNDCKIGTQHQNQFMNTSRINQNKKQQESPIKPSVNAFTQCAYQQMLAQANLIVKQTQDPEAFRQFLEQINSVNQLAALSQVSKPLLNFQPFQLLNNNGGLQKRVPSTRELECHTRNIVQNALFRKHLQEQQKLRLQELISLQSNINPNAPEFTPTASMRKISSDKENFNVMTSAGNNLGEVPINNFNFQQYQVRKHQYPQMLNEQNCSQKVPSILNKFNDNSKESAGIHIKTGEKHIKWNNDQMHYIPNKKYMDTGRPILKASNTNSTSESKLNSYHHQSILKQSQNYRQKSGDQYGFDHFLKTQYNNSNGYFNSKINESIIPSTSTFSEQNHYQHHKNNCRQSQIDVKNPIDESNTNKVGATKVEVNKTETEQSHKDSTEDDNIKEHENGDKKDNESVKLIDTNVERNLITEDAKNIEPTTNIPDIEPTTNNPEDLNTKTN